MKFFLLMLVIPFTAQAAPCERYVCQAVGAGGGAAGTSHVEWAYGNNLAETKRRAEHQCAMSTSGYGCGVTCSENRGGNSGGIFGPGCTDPWAPIKRRR